MHPTAGAIMAKLLSLFFITLKPNLSDTQVYEFSIQARLGTTAHFCEVVVQKWRIGFTRRGGLSSFTPTNIFRVTKMRKQ